MSRAAAGLALSLVLVPEAFARLPRRCVALPESLPVDARWETMRRADACAALEGLTDAERVRALRDAASIHALLGDADGAEALAAKAVAAAPDDGEAALALAEARRDRPEACLQQAERAAARLNEPSRRAAALRLIGDARLDLGADAADAYRKALELSREDVDAWLGLARAEPKTARESLAQAARAAAAAPAWRRAEACRLVAAVAQRLGEKETALEASRRAVAADPDDLESLERLVALGAPAAPVQEAKDDGAPFDEDAFLAQLRDAPGWQQGPGFRRIGARRLEAGRRRPAEAMLLRALERDRRALSTLLLLARVASPDPGLPHLFLGLAQARVALGDAAGALAALERGRRLSPKSEALARVTELLKAGKAAEAASEAKRLRALPW